MSIRNILRPDVSIIGAGIIGNSIALSLQRKGFQVSVYDSNPSPGFGTTSYSSGICRMYYSLLDSAKLSYEGYHYFKDWQNALKLSNQNQIAKLNECGALILKSDKSKDFIKQTSQIMTSIGVPVEELDFLQTKEKVSKLGLDINNNYQTVNPDNENFGVPKEVNDIIGSIYMPESGYVGDPQLAANNLFQAAEEEGVIFNFKSQVTDIIVENGKVTGLDLANNTLIDCPIVINAAGPYSSQINRMIYENNNLVSDININCRPLRIEVSYTNELDKQVNVEKDGTVIIDLDLGVYFRPDIGNKMLIGATEPECDPLIWIDNLAELDDGISDQWTNQIYRAALRMPEMPIPNGTNKKYIVSTYDVSDDWTPIYDKSNIDGYYMAMGTSGNQFKNAGAIGPMFADLVEQVENGRLHDTNPVIHKLKYLNDEINLATFSRLREPMKTAANVFG